MKATIMIVEDDPVTRACYKGQLQNLDKAEIVFCASASEALEALEMCAPDIVIMDNRLPDMTGLELTSIIVMKHPAVIVIAVSGDDRSDLESDMLELGAVSFLKKPVNGRVLYLTIQNFIEIILSRKDREESAEKHKKHPLPKTKPAAKPRSAEPVHSEQSDQFIDSFCNSNISAMEQHMLNTKAEPKSSDQFFSDLADDYEYVDDFMEEADNLSYLTDALYNNMTQKELMDAAEQLDKVSRKLNFLQEFPSIAYSASIMSINLKKMDYGMMNEAATKRLCVFVYDYLTLFGQWVRSVFNEKGIPDIHYMDFQLLGFVMQMESIFYDINVLSDMDENTADEGGSVEFF